MGGLLSRRDGLQYAPRTSAVRTWRLHRPVVRSQLASGCRKGNVSRTFASSLLLPVSDGVEKNPEIARVDLAGPSEPYYVPRIFPFFYETRNRTARGKTGRMVKDTENGCFSRRSLFRAVLYGIEFGTAGFSTERSSVPRGYPPILCDA